MTYFAMFSNPYIYQVVDFLTSITLTNHIFVFSDSILRTLAMTQNGIEGVNSNPALGPHLFVAKILCGTLAGCGGGLWIGKSGIIELKHHHLTKGECLHNLCRRVSIKPA